MRTSNGLNRRRKARHRKKSFGMSSIVIDINLPVTQDIDIGYKSFEPVQNEHTLNYLLSWIDAGIEPAIS
jgi:hypothetical protein